MLVDSRDFDLDLRYAAARADALVRLERSFEAYPAASIHKEAARATLVAGIVLGALLGCALEIVIGLRWIGVTAGLCVIGGVAGLVAIWRHRFEKEFARLKIQWRRQCNSDFCKANSVPMLPDGTPGVQFRELLELEKEQYRRGRYCYFLSHSAITPY